MALTCLNNVFPFLNVTMKNYCYEQYLKSMKYQQWKKIEACDRGMSKQKFTKYRTMGQRFFRSTKQSCNLIFFAKLKNMFSEKINQAVNPYKKENHAHRNP